MSQLSPPSSRKYLYDVLQRGRTYISFYLVLRHDVYVNLVSISRVLRAQKKVRVLNICARELAKLFPDDCVSTHGIMPCLVLRKIVENYLDAKNSLRWIKKASRCCDIAHVLCLIDTLRNPFSQIDQILV